MSPDLERLLEALYERDYCDPDQRARCERNLQRLIDEALARLHGVGRDQLLEALSDRYREFKRARRKPSSLPPHA